MPRLCCGAVIVNPALGFFVSRHAAGVIPFNVQEIRPDFLFVAGAYDEEAKSPLVCISKCQLLPRHAWVFDERLTVAVACGQQDTSGCFVRIGSRSSTRSVLHLLSRRVRDFKSSSCCCCCCCCCRCYPGQTDDSHSTLIMCCSAGVVKPFCNRTQSTTAMA